MTRTLLLLLPFLLLACQDDDDPLMPTEPETPAAMSTTHYLALGDSYTIGTSVSAAERWPTQLAEALADPAPGDSIFSIEVDYVATNGWTTADLQAGIVANEANLREEYGLVSLLIGVNNQFQGRSIAEYERQFNQLLDRAIAFAGGDADRVFVVSIPDYAFTRFGAGRADISRGVNEFNAVGQRLTEARGLPFYNITPISREGLDDPSLVATDGLHPSGKQYGRWVEEVLKQRVRTLLGN